MDWLKTHIWILSTVAGVITYCFTTFASVKYVDQHVENIEARQNRTVVFIKETQLKNDRQFEKVNDKLDTLLWRSKK